VLNFKKLGVLVPVPGMFTSREQKDYKKIAAEHAPDLAGLADQYYTRHANDAGKASQGLLIIAAKLQGRDATREQGRALSEIVRQRVGTNYTEALAAAKQHYVQKKTLHQVGISATAVSVGATLLGAALGGPMGLVGLPLVAMATSLLFKTRHAEGRAAGLDALAHEGVTATQSSHLSGMSSEHTDHGAAWLDRAHEYATLTHVKDPDFEHIDAFKARVIDTLREHPSLRGAQQAADWIASLHNKPNHAKEIEATAEALYGDDPRGEMIKQAARLIPLGEHLSSSALLRGGAMTLEQKKEHIFPINGRAADILEGIPGGEAYAQAIRGNHAEGLTPYLHAVRDLSAMDAPRAWRKDKYPPDGRLPFHAVVGELRANDQKPGRAPEATVDVLARFSDLIHKRSTET
jgi:hypothetical protein